MEEPNIVELLNYEESLNVYRDIKNSLDTSFEEGEAKGEVKGIKKVAKNMKTRGYDIQTISDMTELTIEEIEKL